MIKMYIGGKGSGKTKTLIDLVNSAAESSEGCVICIEKGDKLKLDITYKARLIDTDYYGINDAEALCGFIAGRQQNHFRRCRRREAFRSW